MISVLLPFPPDPYELPVKKAGQISFHFTTEKTRHFGGVVVSVSNVHRGIVGTQQGASDLSGAGSTGAQGRLSGRRVSWGLREDLVFPASRMAQSEPAEGVRWRMGVC